MADRSRHTPHEQERASVPSSSGSNGAPPSPGDGAEARRRSRTELVQKYVVWALGGLLGLVLLAVLVLLIVLQTEWGRDQGKDFIVKRLNTLVDGAEFTAGDLTGNFYGRIALLDLALVKTDGETLVHADTFAARYSLIQLLRNRLKFKNIDLVNPRIWMDQQPDGSWDLFNVIARDDSAAVDTAETWATRLLIELDHLYIADGRVNARFYAPDRDSTLLVRDLYLDMGNAQFGRAPIFEVDSLVARFAPPAQDYWASLRVGAVLSDSLLSIDGFDLTSPRSDVHSAGSLALPRNDVETVTDIDFSLTASPLSFDDIRPFVPGLRPGATVTLDVDVGGRQDQLIVDANARFSDGGFVDVGGVLSPEEPDVTYELAGEIRAFDLSILTGNPSHESVINADLNVDLAGTMLDAVDGTAAATLFDTRFGDLTFDRTTVESTWEEGRARIDAAGGLREMAFSLAGNLRPFDEDPSYNVSGEVAGLNLANFTDGSQQSDIGATFRVDGRGFDPQTAALTADVQLAPSTVNDYRIDYAVLDLSLENSRLSFGTRFRFPDGLLFAQGQARFEDEVSYSVGRGRIENVDVAALIGADSPSSIYGTFSLTGTGTDPNALSLRGDVNLFDSEYGQVQIPAADLNVSLQNGNLRLNTAADLADAGSASFVAEGRPFADRPTISVTSGEFRDIDLGPLTQNPSLSTDLDGTAVFTLRDFGSDAMVMEGRFDLDASRFNEQTINSAYLVGDLNRGNLDFNAQVVLPEGQTRIVGSAQPFRDVPTYDIADGRFTNIDLAAFTGNESLASELTGTFSGQGRGFEPASMVFQGRMEVAPSVINQQQINRISAQVNVQRGRLELTANMDLPEGDTQLAGVVNFLEETPSYAIERGSFQNLNVGALLGNPEFTTSLTGTIEATGTGLDPETMEVEGQLFLTDSQINAQTIDTATVAGALRGGMLSFDARMVAPEGVSDLAGQVDFTGEALAYNVTRGELQGIDVGALTGNPNLSTSITATVAFEGTGVDPETMQLDGTIDFSRSTINQAVVTDGLVAATLRDGRVNLDGNLMFADGTADVQAEAALFQEVPTYQASGTINNVDIGAILGADTLESVLTADFNLAGSGFEPRTMSLQGQIRSDTTRYEGARIAELDVDFAFDAGFLQVDTLVLRSNFADVNAGGEIALFDAQATHSSNFVFAADVHDADPIRAFIPAQAFAMDEGRIEGRVYGRPGNLRFDATTDISSFVYNDIRISGFDGTVVGEITPEGTLSVGEMTAEFDYFALPFITVRSSDFSVNYSGQDIVFSGDFLFDEGRVAHLSGRVDLREEVRALVVEEMDLTFDDEEWGLLLPATITYGDEYRVSNFLLASDEGQIAVDGVVDPNGMQSLILTIESFRFGSVADLVGYPGLDGTLNGELDLTGPYYAPIVDGGLDFDIIAEGDRVGDLDLQVHYDSLRLNLDALLTHVDGSTLAMNGYVPTDLSLAPADTATVGEGVRLMQQQAAPGSDVDFAIVADSFNINWIDPFLDQEVMDDVAGALSASIDVSGTFESPILDGDLRVQNGRIRLPEYNVTYGDIEMVATLAENRLEFTDARMTSGGGSLRADGSVSLTELTLGEFDIDARLDEFLAVRNAQYVATASGDIHLAGTTRQPEITGDLRIISADIFLDQAAGADLAEVELTGRDVRMLEERFGYQVTEADTAVSLFYENLTLNLTVSMDRDTWIRQEGTLEMAIQFEGELDVQKQPGEDPQIFGSIEVIDERSYIDQFSRRFNITSGTITFNGTPTNFYMDVSAEYQVKSRFNPGQEQVTITLGLRGRLDDLEFSLGSNPTMEETDILSYIATGQPAGQTLQLADASDLFVSGGAGLALNEVATVIEGIAGEGLGLDVIEIQHDGLRGAVLIAGKYVSPRVYVGVSQPVTFNSSSAGSETLTSGNRAKTEVTLEYEVFNWLLLKLSGGTSTLRGNLLWEHAY